MNPTAEDIRRAHDQMRIAMNVAIGLLSVGCVEEAYKYLIRVNGSHPVSAEQDVTV